MAEAKTSSLCQVLYLEQTLGSDEYFKHFLGMLGQPAPSRAAHLTFKVRVAFTSALTGARVWSEEEDAHSPPAWVLEPLALGGDDREVGVGSRDLREPAPHLCLWATVLHPLCSTATSSMQPSRIPLGSWSLPSGCSAPLPPMS